MDPYSLHSPSSTPPPSIFLLSSLVRSHITSPPPTRPALSSLLSFSHSTPPSSWAPEGLAAGRTAKRLPAGEKTNSSRGAPSHGSALSGPRAGVGTAGRHRESRNLAKLNVWFVCLLGFKGASEVECLETLHCVGGTFICHSRNNLNGEAGSLGRLKHSMIMWNASFFINIRFVLPGMKALL